MMPSPDLTGTTFRPQSHEPSTWRVLRYRQCGYWTCEEQESKTTCSFHARAITEWAEPPAADAQETQWADSVARLTHAASTGPVPRRNLAVSALAYADRLRTQGRLADGLAQMSRVLTLIGA